MSRNRLQQAQIIIIAIIQTALYYYRTVLFGATGGKFNAYPV